jgi:hypothetical protein
VYDERGFSGNDMHGRDIITLSTKILLKGLPSVGAALGKTFYRRSVVAMAAGAYIYRCGRGNRKKRIQQPNGCRAQIDGRLLLLLSVDYDWPCASHRRSAFAVSAQLSLLGHTIREYVYIPSSCTAPMGPQEVSRQVRFERFWNQVSDLTAGVAP